MFDLIAFLEARLADDEQIARAAACTHDSETGRAEWTARDLAVMASDGSCVVVTELAADKPDRVHIARHDPARVLREVAFKRKLLARYTPKPREPETDAQLHARCGHPEWEYATTEGQRKAFDDYDVPPYDPDTHEPDHTWERNTDAGRDGWERFDYTEESYWRRRLPPDKVRAPYVPKELKLLAAVYADHPDYDEEWRV